MKCLTALSVLLLMACQPEGVQEPRLSPPHPDNDDGTFIPGPTPEIPYEENTPWIKPEWQPDHKFPLAPMFPPVEDCEKYVRIVVFTNGYTKNTFICP